ncbi:MAG: hypothetical protein A2Y23_03570 [Clostridiales bacterium GWB2_37_7]|nr:MAG: hypothetical protein A2Y23_03570 [Clostridiales bacterium GWB2_37_7]
MYKSIKMQKKYLYVYVLIILISSTSYLILNVKDNESPTNKALTLEQVYKLSFEKAQSWDGQALLANISSFDRADIDSYRDVVNGKRRFWNVVFNSPKVNKSYLLTIEDGKIVDEKVVDEEISIIELLEIDNFKFDSLYMLKKAKKLYKLDPGKGWANGYHFTLRKINNKPIITIIGEDSKGYFSRVHFDLNTGDVEVAEHKIPVGGILYLEDKKIALNPNNSALVFNISMSPYFSEDKTIIASTIVDPLTPNAHYQLFLTKDGGYNWKLLDFKANSNKVYFSNNYRVDNKIYAVTMDNIYISQNSGTSWDALLKDSVEIVDAYNIGSTFAVLSREKLFISSDNGDSWKVIDIPENTWRVKIKPDGTLFIVSVTEIYKSVDGKWINVENPCGDDLLDLEIVNNDLICYSQKSIAILNGNTEKWKVIPNTLGQIKEVYKDLVSNTLYIIYDNKTVFILNVGGVSIDKVVIPEDIKDENISFISGSKDSMYYGTTISSSWELLKTKQ